MAGQLSRRPERGLDDLLALAPAPEPEEIKRKITEVRSKLALGYYPVAIQVGNIPGYL